MEKRCIKQSSISLCEKNNNNQQLINLKLVEETTNVEYNLKVNKDVYNRAHNDMVFATTLLEKAKLLQIPKDIFQHNSASNDINVTANDNSKPSCSNITTAVSNTIDENIFDDNIPSETEQVSDTSDTEIIKEKWEHNAILLLISIYKEKSHMLGKGSQKKMWLEISRCMKQKKYNFTASQCNNKMDALKRRYRQTVDHNAQSGNNRKDWIYLDVLDDVFQKKHWVKPLSIAGSNIKDFDHSPLTDNNDENEPPVKQKKVSLTEARANYLKVSLEEKRLKREETANYRAIKLQILKEIKEAFKKQKQ